jgi:hypothetical protein
MEGIAKAEVLTCRTSGGKRAKAEGDLQQMISPN